MSDDRERNELDKKEEKADVEAHMKDLGRNEDAMIDGERRKDDADGPDVEGHIFEAGRSEAARSETGRAELNRKETGKSEL